MLPVFFVSAEFQTRSGLGRVEWDGSLTLMPAVKSPPKDDHSYSGSQEVTYAEKGRIRIRSRWGGMGWTGLGLRGRSTLFVVSPAPVGIYVF